jgi:hypothetical protein
MERLRAMLPDPLLQGIVPVLDHGMIHMPLPPNLETLEKSPASHNGNAQIYLASRLANDPVDNMVAVTSTLHGYAPEVALKGTI